MASTSTKPLINVERQRFASSNDGTMLRKIQGTHTPDDGFNVDVRSMLGRVEDVFRSAAALDGVVAGQPKHIDSLGDKMSSAADLDENKELEIAIITQKVTFEIASKYLARDDVHNTTMSLLKMLSKYSWDGKVVIVLSSLAITYAEFWLVAQQNNNVAKSILAIKLINMKKYSDALKSHFNGLNNLIEAMLAVTKIMVEFIQLPHQYISLDQPPLSVALLHIPTAAYWTIRSVVGCAAHIASLVGMSSKHIKSATEAWELSSLAQKERNIHGHLKRQLDLCYRYIDEKKHMESYRNLASLFEKPHIDNNKILRQLIYLKDDIQPLLEGSSKKRVHVETLRGKTVLLMISDLDISMDDLWLFDGYLYRESRKRPEIEIEIVWLPIVEPSTAWTEANEQRFQEIQSMMPWYSVYHAKVLEPAAIRYIKDVWRFTKEMILVVVDPLGKVVSRNAYHMFFIWGSFAYPFTATREKFLWSKETWSLELVAGVDHPPIVDWADSRNKLFCLYGGEDLDWLRAFNTAAKHVLIEESKYWALVYNVGKNNITEVQYIGISTGAIQHHFGEERRYIWYFWRRIESILYSRLNHYSKDMESDPIIKQIMTLLKLDAGDRGWACFWLDSDMVIADGDSMLKSLRSFKEWGANNVCEDFIPSLRENLLQQTSFDRHHCNRLVLSRIEEIPGKLACIDCGTAMDKYRLYRCHHR